ncbi:hypothetical protein [Lysinibacillus parviboronicapiens]|uniref:hypothetical protein n=2 Tax=Lysinibacillus parviboronicapiens TaxID=436516 RepID=UPI000D38D19F|nr:hypothetical protein [Lysinibacillus parviboronicapiens]
MKMKMNWNWKDFFIVITLGAISILAFFTIIDWTIEKDSIIGVDIAVAFVGTIFGGIISGGLTLIGVKLTIKDQRRVMSQEKVDKAKYIYKKILPTMVTLDFRINDETYLDSSLITRDAKTFNEIINEHSAMLKETEFDFINNIESIHYWVGDIENYFERNVGKVDSEMRTDLKLIIIFKRYSKLSMSILRSMIRL